MTMKADRALVVALLATVLLLLLVWYRLAAAQSVVPLPAPPAPPIAMLPASGVSSTGKVTTPCFTFPLGTLACEDGAANTFAIRGTAGQRVRVYKAFTDAANFQSLDLNVSGSVAEITTNWAGTGTAFDLRLENSMVFSGNTGRITQLGGSAASDNATGAPGVAVTRADGRFAAQTAARNPVATYTTNLTLDGSYEVSANVLVTTATSHAFTVTVAYTDEGSTARTLTLSFTLVAGGALVTSIANANGAVPYMGIAQVIRAKANTVITIATAGTFTTVVYNVEGIIKQVA